MKTLARKLRLADYFALGFGTMVGVGWLVLMDDWLGRGGPLGAVLGFAIGGIILLPVGYVYGQSVFLPRLLLGITMTVFLAVLNYRGIRLSATFQNWTTSMVLLLFVLVVGISGVRGAPANFQPLFH